MNSYTDMLMFPQAQGCRHVGPAQQQSSGRQKARKLHMPSGVLRHTPEPTHPLVNPVQLISTYSIAELLALPNTAPPKPSSPRHFMGEREPIAQETPRGVRLRVLPSWPEPVARTSKWSCYHVTQ